MGGVCRGGTPHPLIPVLSGCSQVRGGWTGAEREEEVVMVGRRDQGGMTIWWCSSTCTHPSLPLTPSHFYMPASLALIWAPTPLADSFCPGIAALGILHGHGEQRPWEPLVQISSSIRLA